MYLLSFLQCAKYTAVCDQIANKSFVSLNAGILGEYCEKTSLRSASHARRQNSVTMGGINKFGGGHKKFNISNPRVWTKNKRSSSRNMRRFSRILGWRQKKKLFISKNARIFTNFGVKPQKKRSLLQNLQKKQFLLTNFGVITIRESQASNCTSVAPSLLLSLKRNPCLGGIVLVWWAQAVI